MEKNKNYCIIAQCDPHNASRHYNGEKVVRRDGTTPVEWIWRPEYLEQPMTLDEANEAMLELACEVAQTKISNWGLAAMNLSKEVQDAWCGTSQEGRYLYDDSMHYYVAPMPVFKTAEAAKKFLALADELKEAVERYMDGSDASEDREAYEAVIEAERVFLDAVREEDGYDLEPELDYTFAESYL